MTIVESSSNVWKRSFQARACAVLGLLAAAFVAGCGGVPKTFYYTLQVPAAPAPSDPRTDYVLGVDHFRAPEFLRDDRIAYYVTPTQMNFYQYHRWGSDPATLVSEFTAEWLNASGAFTQVRMLPVREHVDYTLGGSVRDFEEVDSDGGAKVRLALALSLVRTSDHKLVWSGEQRVETPLPGRGVEGVATALNASCAQALRELVPGLIAQIEQDFKGSGK
ncbi:MAG: ABC-type transport auxiliary lipoprotein family protein [Terriglobia bacterium]